MVYSRNKTLLPLFFAFFVVFNLIAWLKLSHKLYIKIEIQDRLLMRLDEKMSALQNQSMFNTVKYYSTHAPQTCPNIKNSRTYEDWYSIGQNLVGYESPIPKSFLKYQRNTKISLHL